jgi:hypothetical protein
LPAAIALVAFAFGIARVPGAQTAPGFIGTAYRRGCRRRRGGSEHVPFTLFWMFRAKPLH